jgi:DNA polymerase/3'-5' exonuclease PolX
MSSSNIRYPFGQAYLLASRMVDLLAPECDRIEIAGSLRRKQLTVGDVEIVLIPKTSIRKTCTDKFKPQPDLFDEAVPIPMVDHNWKEEPIFGHERITRILHEEGYEFGCNGPLLKKVFRSSRGPTFEIYLTTPEKWGVVYTIRTGSAIFVRRLVTSKQDYGLCPSNLHIHEGRVWRNGVSERDANGKRVWRVNGEAIDTPEEEDVFRVLGLDWIEPEERQ